MQEFCFQCQKFLRRFGHLCYSKHLAALKPFPQGTGHSLCFYQLWECSLLWKRLKVCSRVSGVEVGVGDPDLTCCFKFMRANLLLSGNCEILLWFKSEIEFWKPAVKSSKLLENLCLNIKLTSFLVVLYDQGGGLVCWVRMTIWLIPLSWVLTPVVFLKSYLILYK